MYAIRSYYGAAIRDARDVLTTFFEGVSDAVMDEA